MINTFSFANHLSFSFPFFLVFLYLFYFEVLFLVLLHSMDKINSYSISKTFHKFDNEQTPVYTTLNWQVLLLLCIECRFLCSYSIGFTSLLLQACLGFWISGICSQLVSAAGTSHPFIFYENFTSLASFLACCISATL